MADSKISALTSWTPVSGDVIPFVHAGANYKGDVSALPVSTATSSALALKEDKANKGIANGYAPLDSSGKVPAANLPSGGSWDVVWPASSTDSHVVFFDGTSGKLVKDSGLTLSGNNTWDQDLSGLVPTSRTLTINGVTYDLSENRSWTVSGGGGWTAKRETITSAGQTVFNLGFAYVPGDKGLTVYVNGLLQTIGTHYTETGVSQVTFTSTVTAGNVVDFQYSAWVGATWPQWPAWWPVNSVKGTAVLNFDTEDSKATVTVSSALISASNLIGALFVPQETAETSIDDFVNNGVTVTVANIVDNVSFDIIGTASNNATWNYTVYYSLNY